MRTKRVVTFAVALGIAAGLLLFHLRPDAMPSAVLVLQHAGQAWTDTKLTGAVRTALGLNRGLTPFAIRVETRQGVVRLGGAVAAEDLRRLAERVAGAVPGVQAVTNQLTVDLALARTRERTLAESLRDRALEGQAQLALALDRGLAGTEIDVRANRGELTLAGRVDSPEQRRKALEIASQLPEAASVSDAIALCAPQGPPALTTAERAQAAQRALEASAHLAGRGLTVRVDGDRLVLLGTLPSELARDLAGALAQAAAGVPVENALQVQ